MPFEEVNAYFARKEGEGDLTLHGGDVHKLFFANNGGFAPGMMLWCKEFTEAMLQRTVNSVASALSIDTNR